MVTLEEFVEELRRHEGTPSEELLHSAIARELQRRIAENGPQDPYDNILTYVQLQFELLTTLLQTKGGNLSVEDFHAILGGTACAAVVASDKRLDDTAPIPVIAS